MAFYDEPNYWYFMRHALGKLGTSRPLLRDIFPEMSVKDVDRGDRAAIREQLVAEIWGEADPC